MKPRLSGCCDKSDILREEQTRTLGVYRRDCLAEWECKWIRKFQEGAPWGQALEGFDLLIRTVLFLSFQSVCLLFPSCFIALGRSSSMNE